jgi:hypothetical protein
VQTSPETRLIVSPPTEAVLLRVLRELAALFTAARSTAMGGLTFAD